MYLYPTTKATISQLLDQNMCDIVTKTCSVCMCNTSHTELIKIQQNPQILLIVINRFDNSLSSRKNNIMIYLEKEIYLESTSYHLVASVNHHGRSPSSGHYTSKVFFTNTAYLCNDHLVNIFHHNDDHSDSAYIVLYRRNDA